MKKTLFFICLLLSMKVVAQGPLQDNQGIEPQLLQQDFQLLYQQLQLNHSKLFAYRSKAESDQQFEQISTSINRPMARLEFYRLIAPFVSSFKDGHTSISIGFEDKDFEQYVQSGGTFFPLEVVILDNKLYCKSNPFSVGTIQKGDEILSINQVPVQTLLPTLRNLMPADGEAFGNATVQRLFSYVMWLNGHQGAGSNIAFRTEKKVEQEQLPGISKEQLMQLIFNTGGPMYELKLYPESKLAVVKINSYGNLSKSKAFIDSCFQVIRHSDIRNIALDLRRNGGGNSTVGDYFLAHVTRKPYNTISSKTWRVGPLVQQMDTSHWVSIAIAKSQEKFSKEGEFLHSPFYAPEPPIAINDSSLFSPVRLFLLTSSRTYSSAHMTAMAVKCGGLGTIIGQPTGERLDLTGETLLYQLPHSKLSIYIPVASYKTACGDGAQVGVQPDFSIATTIEDLRQERDPELVFLKELLKKSN